MSFINFGEVVHSRSAHARREPRDIANMLLFLARDEVKHINGTEMVADIADTVETSGVRQRTLQDLWMSTSTAATLTHHSRAVSCSSFRRQWTL